MFCIFNHTRDDLQDAAISHHIVYFPSRVQLHREAGTQFSCWHRPRLSGLHLNAEARARFQCTSVTVQVLQRRGVKSLASCSPLALNPRDNLSAAPLCGGHPGTHNMLRTETVVSVPVMEG